DPDMIKWHKEHKVLSKLNNYSFDNKKVNVLNQDAISFMRDTKEKYDIVIIDLVDPTDIQIGRLYSTLMYQGVKSVLKPNGLFTTQSTSSYYTQKTFLSIKKTIESVGFNTLSTQINVPSFGQWGFNIGSLIYSEKELKNKLRQDINQNYKKQLKYVNEDILHSITAFDKNYYKNYDDIEISTQFNLKSSYYYNEQNKRY
ncbi:MAG: hypothetical protein U9N10_04620, partial [Bacillota bacterium]|nr:hypothetical protein [Bacillota bacterium]